MLVRQKGKDVSFTVNPASTIKNGDEICNEATIYFDNNAPITTTCWNNVFDLIKPVSKVNSLPVKESKDTFAVSWNGSDNLSGVRDYEIFVSINDSAFIPWLDTASTRAFYAGVYGNKYSFYSIATDNAEVLNLLKHLVKLQLLLIPLQFYQ